jgi:predicted F0F1-ATPase subunit
LPATSYNLRARVGIAGAFVVVKYTITLETGMKGAKPRNPARTKKSTGETWIMLGIVGQIGYTIAIPLVLGVLGGVWVDIRLGTRPVGTLIGLGIGAVISVVGFGRTLRELLKKYKK